MRLASPAFENNGSIPEHYTCTGEGVSPELLIEDVPAAAQSLVLTVVDIDAAAGIWVHWVMYDIPVLSRIPEGASPGKQGVNSFGDTGYGGPCPAAGRHRYVFNLYALDASLDLPDGLPLAKVQASMTGRVIAETGMVGLYRKPPVPEDYQEIKI